jgi:hypothetical protein
MQGWARAQGAPGEQVRGAASQALFEEGRQLMQAGRFSEACVKLAESQRIDPQAGTLLNLAVCHESEGKTATAWLEYNDALALAARDDDGERKEIARQRIEKLENSLSRLVVLLPDAPPPEYWIEIDGVRLDAAAMTENGVPVDPGSHRVRFGAPGSETAELEIGVEAAVTRVPVQLPQLASTPAPVSQPPQLHPQLADRSEPNMSVRWAVNGAVLGAGAVGIALGTYFGLRAKSDWDTRNQLCRDGCNTQAVVAGSNAKRAATLATVTAATGLIGVGLGIYLVVTTPSARERATVARLSATATERSATLELSGSF